MSIQPQQKKSRRTVIVLSIVVIAMLGFSYLLVPFYNALCKTFGINGKTSAMLQPLSTTVDSAHKVHVQFITTKNSDLNWDFYPKTKSLDLYTGENKLVTFVAKNNTDHAMTVQAIPSVTPGLAANYIKKTECFCFERQTLKAGESLDMPVVFHVDVDLPKKIQELTLSYTLFAVKN